jgi:5-formyltetrahydrofolate cyclo-ligase
VARDPAPRIVAGFSPIRDEIDPTPLMLALQAKGARLCLPVTPPRGSSAPLTFRAWSPGDPLDRSPFGVPEPHPDASEVEPDLLLVPLLAFDGRGGRLGYGAGHYDRTLRALRARRKVIAVGLAYAAQARDDLPLEPHDEPLDAILSEMGYMPLQEDG